MTTLHEMIYHVQSLMRGGVGNESDPVAYRQIGRWIDQARAHILVINWNKYGYDHTLLEQDPGVIMAAPVGLKEYIINGTPIKLDDRNVNTANGNFYFYKNRWKATIPELIGLSGHQDLRIGTGVDDVFTTPIVEHENIRFLRHLKFSGYSDKYCWSRNYTKIYPHLNEIYIETGGPQDLTLAAKNVDSQSYVVATNAGTPLVEINSSGQSVPIYQPFLRIHGIFARPLEVEGWFALDPQTAVKTAKTLRYPVTEALKEQIVQYIKEAYIAPMLQIHNDRMNDNLQETSLDAQAQVQKNMPKQTAATK